MKRRVDHILWICLLYLKLKIKREVIEEEEEESEEDEGMEIVIPHHGNQTIPHHGNQGAATPLSRPTTPSRPPSG